MTDWLATWPLWAWVLIGLYLGGGTIYGFVGYLFDSSAGNPHAARDAFFHGLLWPYYLFIWKG